MTKKEEQAAADAVRRRLLDDMPVSPDELALEALRAVEVVHKQEQDARKARTLKAAWAFLIIVLVVIGATILVATA